MPDLPKKLKSKLRARTVDNALRLLSDRTDLVDFSSNDYLGFSRFEAINDATLKLLPQAETYKNGATGSRLLSGNHSLYKKLETRLVEDFDSGSALVFNSGYDANIGFFSSIPQRGDIVFYDELIHASIRDGIKMGNAKSYKFNHNSLESLKDKIEQSVRALPKLRERTMDTTIYVVTESVFSMDGDSPDLKAFAEFCKDNRYYLVVDEAHAIGVYGKNGTGLIQGLRLENEVFARIITFGKALGVHGAAVLGSKSLTDYLINFSRSFIYTTALPPHSIALIIGAFGFQRSENGEERRIRLKKNIDFFKSQIKENGLGDRFLPSDSAIHCCLISGNVSVKSIAHQLQDSGFDVRPILSPTVPKDKERLRFCLHSYNSDKEIKECLSILAKLSGL